MFFFLSDSVTFICHLDEPKGSKSNHTGVIVGAVLAVLVFLVLAVLAGIYAIRQKRRAKRSAGANPFGKK